MKPKLDQFGACSVPQIGKEGWKRGKLKLFLPALFLSNCREDILCHFVTLGPALFKFFCQWLIWNCLHNATFKWLFFSTVLTVGQDAVIALQSWIHTVYTPTGEALYVQGTLTTPAVCYHRDAGRDTEGLPRQRSTACCQLTASESPESWIRASEMAAELAGLQLQLETCHCLTGSCIEPSPRVSPLTDCGI